MSTSAATQGQAINAGDIRRHLLGLAETNFTGILYVDGPTTGCVAMHDGSIWDARRCGQLHVLDWLRSVGALPAEEPRSDAINVGITLRQAAAENPNLDLSVIESRTFDYISTEVCALAGVTTGLASLVPGDATDIHFVAAWPVAEILSRTCEAAPRTKVSVAARANLLDLGVILE